MKNKPNLQNIDRSESGLLQIDNVTLGFLETTSISDGEMTLTLDPRYSVIPPDVLSAWNDWQKVKNNTFGLYSTEDNWEVVYCEFDDLQAENFERNLRSKSHWNSELKKYVKAYRFILNLLLRSGEIEIFDKPSQVEIVFNEVNKSISVNNLWLEYYLLNNQRLLKRLNLTPPRKREYRPGKVEAKQYEYIKELSERSIKSDRNSTKECYLCNWLLTYSSPAQIWFGLQVHHLKEVWFKKITPGAIKTKKIAFKEEKVLLDIMKESFEEIQLKLIEDKDAEDLSFDRAFLFTQIRFEKLHESNKYIEFVKARQAKNNYLRNGGKSKGTGVQTLRTDDRGNLMIGNRKVQSYDEKTGIFILI